MCQVKLVDLTNTEFFRCAVQLGNLAAEVYRWRKEQGLPVDPVMLHTGAMPGEEKEPFL